MRNAAKRKKGLTDIDAGTSGRPTVPADAPTRRLLRIGDAQRVRVGRAGCAGSAPRGWLVCVPWARAADCSVGARPPGVAFAGGDGNGAGDRRVAVGGAGLARLRAEIRLVRAEAACCTHGERKDGENPHRKLSRPQKKLRPYVDRPCRWRHSSQGCTRLQDTHTPRLVNE